MSDQPRTIVIGGGLAGLTCALDLAEAGADVVLLEARDVVGGRTGSWHQDGMHVEAGLHRWLGHFRALPRLLRRCAVEPDEVVCWEDEIEIRLPGGPRGSLGLAPLHKPGKTVGSVLGNNRLLSPWDKASLVPFFAAGLARYLANPERVDRWSTAGYARRFGTTPRAVERLLVPLTAGIFFLPPDRFSAADFFGLVAPIIGRLHGFRLGAFTGPMTDVMCAPIAAAIERAGGAVRTNTPVERLLVQDNRVIGIASGDEQLLADHVVLATSIGPAQHLLRPAFAEHPWFRPFLDLPATPSATIQLDLRAPALPADRATFAPGTALACFSEQSRTTFPGTAGRLSVILSPPELAENVIRSTLVTHPDDFPSLEPNHLAARPSQQTPIPGLTLAGDYTRQRFLATMEGAVISGHLATRAALRHWQSPVATGP